MTSRMVEPDRRGATDQSVCPARSRMACRSLRFASGAVPDHFINPIRKIEAAAAAGFSAANEYFRNLPEHAPRTCWQQSLLPARGNGRVLETGCSDDSGQAYAPLYQYPPTRMPRPQSLIAFSDACHQDRESLPAVRQAAFSCLPKSPARSRTPSRRRSRSPVAGAIGNRCSFSGMMPSRFIMYFTAMGLVS